MQNVLHSIGAALSSGAAQAIAAFVVTALAAAASALFLKLLDKIAAAAIAYFDAHVKNAAAESAFAKLVSLVETVVRRHEQEFVEDLKAAAADGRISPEELKAALAKQKNEAVAEVKSLLGAKGLEQLAADLGLSGGTSVGVLIEWVLEAVLHKTKIAKVATVPIGPAAVPAVVAKIAPAAGAAPASP